MAPIILLSLLLAREISMQGVGVNFGSFYSKGAMLLIKKSFTMVEDTVSKTKTPVVLSFCKDSRYFEYQAKGKTGRNFCTTFQFPALQFYSA